MNARLRSLWTRQRWLLVAFALALAVTLFFAIRLALFWVFWNDPVHRNQPIEAWMPLRYIAHSWHLTPEEVETALNLPRDEKRGRTSLRQIADERGVPVATLIDALNTLIANRPDPAPDPAPLPGPPANE